MVEFSEEELELINAAISRREKHTDQDDTIFWEIKDELTKKHLFFSRLHLAYIRGCILNLIDEDHDLRSRGFELEEKLDDLEELP